MFRALLLQGGVILKDFYQEFRRLGLQKEFWKACIVNWTLLLLSVTITSLLGRGWLLGWFLLASYFTYALRHHFYTNMAAYRLKAKYKAAGLSPATALNEYQTDLCLSHTENTQARRLWWIVTGGTLLSVIFLPDEKYVCLSVFSAGLLIVGHFVAGLAEMRLYDEGFKE